MLGMMREEKRRGRGVDRGPESLPLDLTVALWRSIRVTFAKPRKALDKGDPEHSGFRN